MFANTELQKLLAQQQFYLQRAITLLEGDDRVLAAWLYGSLGRGTSDEWSDLDLWVVAADSHIAEIRADRRDYVAQLGEPLLIVDAPQNALPGGAFVSVLYKGDFASQHVDWTWQAASDARIPPDAKVLLNRGAIPHADPSPSLSTQERIERAKNQTAYFWMMVPVVARYIARRRLWGVVNLLNMLRYTLEDIAKLTEQGDISPLHATSSTLPPPARPADQLATLQDMAREMERLVANVPSLHEVVSHHARYQIRHHIQLATDALND